MTNNICFTFTADSGLEQEASFLAKSINKHHPDSDIFVFIPENNDINYEKFNPSNHSNLTILSAPIPIDEYPISAKIKAAELTSEKISDEALVLLDTDTILINPFTLPEYNEQPDLLATPVAEPTSYWTSFESEDDWKYLFDKIGVEYPTSRGYTVAGNHPCPVRYLNSGVVVFFDTSLPEQWLQYTQQMYELRELDEMFFIDQLSLAVLSETCKTYMLPIKQNFIFPLYGLPPSDISVLHYGSLENLSYIPDPLIRGQLSEYGINRTYSITTFLKIINRPIRKRLAGYLSHSTQKKLRTTARNVINYLPSPIKSKIKRSY